MRTGFGAGSNIRYHKVFGRSEVAMVISPLRNLQEILDQNVLRLDAIGIAPLPSGPAGRASIVDGDVYAISSNIQDDKDKMDAAWEYIRFMTSDRAHEIETRVYVESGYGRFVRNPYWLKDFGYDEYFAEISPQHLAAFDEALKYGRPEPFCPGYPAMSDRMTDPISMVLRVDDFEATEAELKSVVDYSNLHFFKLYPEKERRLKQRVALILAIVVSAGVLTTVYFPVSYTHLTLPTKRIV